MRAFASPRTAAQGGGAALYPLQWLMLQPVELADRAWAFRQSLQAAQQAATRRKKQMAQMSVRAGETDQLLRENAELRQLLALRCAPGHAGPGRPGDL